MLSKSSNGERMKLLITLGHNSSAILVKDKSIICGYEEERLSKVKSDSSYPKLAIEECIKHCDPLDVKDIYVSHWFDSFELQENKYFQPKHLKARFKNAVVHSLSEDFTHHDAHANSVWNFSGTDIGLTIVADGFGNEGETLSVYRDGALVHRSYSTSLGLIYQYTTSFLGMKENQDEYKLLGMESHVTKEDYEALQPVIRHYVAEYIDALSFTSHKSTVAKVCSVNKSYVCNEMLEDVLSYCSGSDAAIAYFVQAVLERVMIGILYQFYQPGDNLMFSGGVFYNVKLNNTILNEFAASANVIEFMPVCGDQGAAMGFIKDLNIDTLLIGTRTIADKILPISDEIFFCMKGAMEFGPRALGNTSCIAIPTKANTEAINKMNGRPNIMPMAPMISAELANKYCRNITSLGRCKEFMIVATDWLGPISEYEGVLHKKPCSDVYTCRPQVVDNCWTSKFGVVINTSLNAHGQPILFDELDYTEMRRIHEELK